MTQPFREKRAHHRHRVLAGAEIQNNWKGTRCTVRDVSVNGANLVVSPAIRLQQYLKLRISKWSVCVDAEVVWRDGEPVGYVRAGSYGFTLGGAVGLVMVEAGEPVNQAYLDGGEWEVEIAGRRHPARVSLRPMYDPEMGGQYTVTVVCVAAS